MQGSWYLQLLLGTFRRSQVDHAVYTLPSKHSSHGDTGHTVSRFLRVQAYKLHDFYFIRDADFTVLQYSTMASRLNSVMERWIIVASGSELVKNYDGLGTIFLYKRDTTAESCS